MNYKYSGSSNGTSKTAIYRESTTTDTFGWSSQKYGWAAKSGDFKMRKTIPVPMQMPSLLFTPVDTHYKDIDNYKNFGYARIPPTAFSGGFTLTGLTYTTNVTTSNNTTWTDANSLTFTVSDSSKTTEQIKNLTTIRINGVLYPI